MMTKVWIVCTQVVTTSTLWVLQMTQTPLQSSG